MKKLITVIMMALIAFSSVISVAAENGKVIYSGNSGDFIFEPGSDYSMTDLFPNFKGVMPGDELIQTITVKNNADKKVKAEIYIRSLGAHEDSVEFLSQLGLKVALNENNEMPYMFDAKANETAQLTDWVHLGTLYSGGEVNLDVILTVPVELSNGFQNSVGYIDWEFKVEELPIDPDDPKPPQTGDDSNEKVLYIALILALITVVILIIKKKKDQHK